MGDAVSQFVERFRSIGVQGQPCSVAEIDDLDRVFGVILPAAYKAYLRIAGQYPPRAWVGSDCEFSRLAEIQDGGRELLCECRQPPLPPRAFVFLMHQGYQFFYFIADGSSEDPSVFYYLEGEPSVEQKFARFSDFVAECGDKYRRP